MAWQSLLYRCVPQCVARALMRPVRILVFVQTALALVFCSNCASACFHILGFIASHRRWRGNPVNYARTRMRATLFAL